MVGGHLGFSNHEMIEFLILGEVRRGVSKTTVVNFQRTYFGLFSTLVESPLGGTEGHRETEHSSRRKSWRCRSRLSPCVLRQTVGGDDWSGRAGLFCWGSGVKRRVYHLLDEGVRNSRRV